MVQRLAAVVVSVWDHTESLPSAIGKGHWPMREQILSASWTEHKACQRVPRTNTDGNVFITGPAAPMPAKLSNEQMDSLMELGPQEQRTQKSAAKRDANK